MKVNNKKIFVLFFVCILIMQLCSTTAFAVETPTSESVIYQDDVNLDIPVAPNTVTASDFIPNFMNFTFYSDRSFSQGTSQMDCVPIAGANILSYYKSLGKSNLFAGATITQSEFDQLCSDMSWNSISGTSLINGANGLITYANRKGYSATKTVPIFNTWSTFTSYIASDSPVLINEKNKHSSLAVGYRVEDGINYVYTYSGFGSNPIMWVPWTDVEGIIKITIN